MKLQSCVLEVADLGPDDRGSMFWLMQRNYENVRRRQFEADLDAKKWVIIVRSSSHQLVGFSTQVILDERVGGQHVRALYSGDTVVDPEFWGDPALAQAWGNFAIQLIARYPAGRLYWFLTSKGFRTYRYLPLFFRSYYPHLNSPTPRWERLVIDAFGRQVGGANYFPGDTIIRASDGKDFVRTDLGEPGSRLDTDPHIRFFVERNPSYERGDELCCLAPLTRENFTRVACRVIERRTQPSNYV